MFPTGSIEAQRLAEIVAVRRLCGMGGRVELLGNVFDWRGFSVQVFPAFNSAERRAKSLALGRC